MLQEKDVRALLSYKELIPAIRQALMDYSAGRVRQPVRTILAVPEHHGWFGVMPAVYGPLMGAKLVTFYPHNSAAGKHTHMAVIQLLDSTTGEPLLAMDGRLITEMRTAAVSAVAIDHLAEPQSKVLAILGSGVQARSHLRALAEVRSFAEVRVWSRTFEHAQTFAGETGARPCNTAEEAVSGADVVLCLTSAAEPVLNGRWLNPNAMVCAIGAATPDRRELDEGAMRGPVVVECRQAASREAGDIVLAQAEICAEIGELLNGAQLKRNGMPIVFKSVGLAVEDIAAAKLVYDKYIARA
jgi:ornithine cyclodeaminase/alanine dehydrogenase-like protein (mu-crystallin family)